MTDPWAEVVSQVAKLRTPSERAKAFSALLDSVPDLQGRLREGRQRAYVEMHEGGMSWSEIGEDQGVHRTRASQIARGVAGGAKPKKGEE